MVEKMLTGEQEDFVNFVLSGGGIKGVSYVGLYVNLYGGITDFFAGYLNHLEGEKKK